MWRQNPGSAVSAAETPWRRPGDLPVRPIPRLIPPGFTRLAGRIGGSGIEGFSMPLPPIL